MASLTEFLLRNFGPGAIINALEKQDPKALGKELADIVDQMLDKQFGFQKSEKVQQVLVPFLKELVEELNKCLLADG